MYIFLFLSFLKYFYLFKFGSKLFDVFLGWLWFGHLHGDIYFHLPHLLLGEQQGGPDILLELKV